MPRMVWAVNGITEPILPKAKGAAILVRGSQQNRPTSATYNTKTRTSTRTSTRVVASSLQSTMPHLSGMCGMTIYMPNRQPLSYHTNTFSSFSPALECALYKKVFRQSFDPYQLVPRKYNPRPRLGFCWSPRASRSHPGRQVVVLDCEMVGCGSGPLPRRNEVVQMSLVDFLTGEVLMNNRFVWPEESVTDWRTRIHGINEASFDKAYEEESHYFGRDRPRDRVIWSGWREARKALWKFVDDDTILIGHALHGDLHALQMMHPWVVDSALITVDPCREGRMVHANTPGLKRLVEDLLGMEIRANSDWYSSREDVLVTREFVIWCLLNPEDLLKWAGRYS